MSREAERLHIVCFIDTKSKATTDCKLESIKQACSACVNYLPACSVFSAAPSKCTPLHTHFSVSVTEYGPQPRILRTSLTHYWNMYKYHICKDVHLILGQTRV